MGTFMVPGDGFALRMGVPSPVRREEALARMTAALEAAKRAKDAGVQKSQIAEAKGLLKKIIRAYERGDFVTAVRHADTILQRFALYATRGSS